MKLEKKPGKFFAVILFFVLVLVSVCFASSEEAVVLPEEEKYTGFVSDYTDEEAAAAFIARTMPGTAQNGAEPMWGIP